MTAARSFETDPHVDIPPIRVKPRLRLIPGIVDVSAIPVLDLPPTRPVDAEMIEGDRQDARLWQEAILTGGNAVAAAYWEQFASTPYQLGQYNRNVIPPIC